MSNNRSRAEKNEAHFRKPARSGSSSQQRSFSGSSGKKGGGGTAPPPSSSINSSSSLTTNRSFKGSNAQGGQSRVIATSGNSVSAAARGHDGPCEQSSLSGASDAPVSGDSVRPNVASTQRSTPAVPRPPSSQSATGASDLMAPTTPAKGDVSVAFPLQFGTISPSFMNGMQIPARTSSAPPNLDEQKRDQARHDSLRAVPTFPIPSVPKQQQPKKDVGVVNKSNTGEPHYLVQVKRDVHAQIPAVPDAIQSQRSFVRPNIGMSMPMPQVPVQFGGPNRQIQSQGMTATSRQMSVSLVGGNTAQLPPQVFASNLQSHSLQPQGMIHQGQNMSFPPQMGHQLVPQLGKLGFGIPPQVAQQVGNFGVPRKVVKITHPETHEELTALYLDGGSLGLRLHPNVPLQSQPISSFTPDHQINSYSSMQTNSFNPTSIIFQSPTSHPLTNMQMTPSSPASRFNYQVNQAPQTASSMNPSSFNPFSVTMSGAPMHSIAETSILHCAPDAHTVAASFAPSPSVQVRVKPASGSLEEKIRHSVSVNSHVNKGESPKLLGPPGEALSFHPQRVSVSLSENSLQLSKPGPEPSTSIPLSVKAKYSAASSSAISFERLLPSTSSSAPDVPAEESTPVLTNTESRRETVRKSDSIKDHQKKPGGKALQHSQPQHQADASDPAGSSNSSLLKSSGEVAKYPKHMQAPPSKVVGSTASLSSWPSQGLESGSSLKDGNSETVENKAIPTPSETRDSVLESTEEPLTDICGGVPGPSETVAGSFQIGAGSICEPSNSSSDNLDAVHNAKGNECTLQEVQLKQETMGSAERGKPELPEGPTHDSNDFEINDGPASSESVEVGKQTEWGSNLKETSVGNGLGFVETKQEHNEEAMECNAEVDTMIDNCIRSTTSLDSDDAEINLSIFVSSPASCEDKTSTLDATTSRSEGTGCQEVLFTETSVSQSALVPTSFYSDTTSKPEGKGAKNNSAGSVSIPVSGSKDKSILEPKKAKISNLRGHKKRREILQKADAAGTNTDLYMAYKHPEEKQETTISLESKYSTSSIDVKQVPADATAKNVVASEEDGQGKDEPDDWEDAAEISSPKLKILDIGEQIQGGLVDHDEDVNGVLGKKYSRDFLLTISKQCTHLPADFEITSDIAKALVAKVDRDSYPSSGRIIDRLTGVSQPDRQGSGMVDDDKWSKLPGTSGWDPRLEIGLGGTAVDFRPSQGGNHGFLRNPRGQIPGQHVGGILPGPMQSPVSHGGIQRNGPDADRWQKGLIPSPHAPLQVMHKAEKKYEVRKVSDKEETKQRQLKAILNKLTPQNFEKLFEQVKEVKIDNAVTLTGVISQIFDKALMEPTFCEMYANFCYHLAGELPDLCVDNEKITFKRLLLNKCQEEFERGAREQAEANRVEEEGEIKCSEVEREEKKTQARRRMLGNIRLIGELYKKKMLTERIMHKCIQKLLGQDLSPDEEDIEALCKLMSTIGEMIDHPKAKEHMDAYFDKMTKFSNNMKLSARVRFMLKDSIDLRKNKWQQRRKIDGPKKIEEVHRDAAQERQQASRLARGSGIISSARRGQPIDYGSRESTMLSSPNAQMGGFRGLPPHVRGYGAQDVRLEERNRYESRVLSVPLPQRPIDDNPITLGPQGGLGRGMSMRGQSLVSSVPLADISPSSGDSRILTAGPNGYSSVSEGAPYNSYNSREEFRPRYITERFTGPFANDHSNSQERNMHIENRDLRNADCSFKRSFATSPATRLQGSSVVRQNVPSEKLWPEELLREKSIAAIREFYSAKDENEVVLCIKDMNSPSFYSSMISIWVTDSFERKDRDRDHLAKLLVYLKRFGDGLLSQVQLLKGFESVLASLEDAVNDAPKAAEFLGDILAKVILGKVIPLREIGRLIHEGGEEPGRLLEIGLAAEVLGSILEIIKSEKGESVLNEICSSSNISLKDFRPPAPIKSRKLDLFIKRMEMLIESGISPTL